MYEMVTGASPFYVSGEKSKVDMFKRIVRCEYAFPASLKMLSPTSVDLIRRLLVRDPAKRLGNLSNNGVADIRGHSFFAEMDWMRLVEKELSPPWIPEIQSGESVYDAHFDTGQFRDRTVSFGKPLSRAEQSAFKDF